MQDFLKKFGTNHLSYMLLKENKLNDVIVVTSEFSYLDGSGRWAICIAHYVNMFHFASKGLINGHVQNHAHW